MGKVFDEIDEKLAAWIGRQRMFFVGPAPSGSGGHVNVSPKGPIESLRILGPHEVAYQDVIGSGAETIAHLRDNGRIVVMLCAFEGPPRILRLHGRGEVVQLGDPAFDEALAAFDVDAAAAEERGARAVVRVEVTRIADSCGYGVPQMRVEAQRTQAAAWRARQRAKHGPDALRAYAAERNSRSIDGLPAVDPKMLSPGGRV